MAIVVLAIAAAGCLYRRPPRNPYRRSRRASSNVSPVEPPPPIGEAVVTHDVTTCTFDGPTEVTAGQMGFRSDSIDPTWVAAVAHLAGDLPIEEAVAWVEANPAAQD